MNIFVARLASGVSSENLRALFEEFGTVDSAKVIIDRETGNSRGFGFVEMADSEEANAAIRALDSSEYKGRKIVVKEAEERDARPASKAPRRPSAPRSYGQGQGQDRYNSRPDRGNRRTNSWED